MVTVPCDCPHFPLDLVARLAEAVGDAEVCLARSPAGPEPAFCLVRREAESSLVDSLSRGERSIERWAALRALRTTACLARFFADLMLATMES